MTISDLLTTPLPNLVGGTAILSGTAAGTVYFVKWLFTALTKRLEVREASVDGSTDRLLTGTLGWAEDLRTWAHGVEGRLADCLAREEKHIEELGTLRAQLNARGAIAQEAQKVAAVASLSRARAPAPSDGTEKGTA